MTAFPEWIIPYSGGPLQVRPIQRAGLNIGNLIESIPKSTPSSPKTGTLSKPKKTKIEGLEGAVNQYQGNIENILAQQEKLYGIYGSDATITPEWQQYNQQLEEYTSPRYQNIIDRKTKDVDAYEKHTLGNRGLYNLNEFQNTGGIRTMTHQQLLENQENGQHQDLPNVYGNGLITPYGLDKNAPNYIEGLNSAPNLFTYSDALDELDQIFDKADNQFNEKARAWVQKQTVAHISGTQTVNQKDADDFFTLQEAAQEALFQFGLAPKVERDAQGRPLKKVDKKGKPILTPNGGFVYEYIRDEDGNIQYEGGLADLNSKLGAGMMQGFLSSSNGGQSFNGKNLRHTEDGEGYMKGMVNQDFWKEFQGYVGNQIGQHFSKRANVKASRSTAFREERAHQAKAGAISDVFARVLHSGTKLDAATVMKVTKGMDIPVIKSDQTFWEKIYKDMGLSSPELGKNRIFSISKGANDNTYISFNKEMTPNKFNEVLNDFVDKKWGDKKYIKFDLDNKSGALISIDSDFNESGVGYTKENYKEYITKKFNSLYASTQGKEIHNLNGIAKYDKINFQYAPEVKQLLEDFNFRKKGSNKMVLNEFNNSGVVISAGSNHDASSVLNDNMELVGWGGALQLNLKAKASNFQKMPDGTWGYVGVAGNRITAPEMKSKDRILDASSGGLLPIWTEESFEGASALTNQAVKEGHPNAMRLAPTGYYAKAKIRIPKDQLEKTLEQWSKIKVYTNVPSYNPATIKKYADIVYHVAHSAGELDKDKGGYAHLYNELNFYGSKKAVVNNTDISSDDYDKILQMYKDNNKNADVVAKEYLSHILLKEGADPKEQMNTAEKTGYFMTDKRPSAEEFIEAIKNNTVNNLIRPEATSVMNFALDGEDKDQVIFHIWTDVTDNLTNSQFNKQQKTKEKFNSNNIEYMNNMREGGRNDLDGDLNTKISLVKMQGL